MIEMGEFGLVGRLALRQRNQGFAEASPLEIEGVAWDRHVTAPDTAV